MILLEMKFPIFLCYWYSTPGHPLLPVCIKGQAATLSCLNTAVCSQYVPSTAGVLAMFDLGNDGVLRVIN
jgi:hypothetical protein